MVCVNTQVTGIKFTHFVEVPSSKCLIGTAREETTRKTHVYLIFNQGRIYKRNGLGDSWNELDNHNREAVSRLVRHSLKNKNIPYFTTSKLKSLLN